MRVFSIFAASISIGANVTVTKDITGDLAINSTASNTTVHRWHQHEKDLESIHSATNTSGNQSTRLNNSEVTKIGGRHIFFLPYVCTMYLQAAMIIFYTNISISCCLNLSTDLKWTPLCYIFCFCSTARTVLQAIHKFWIAWSMNLEHPYSLFCISPSLLFQYCYPSQFASRCFFLVLQGLFSPSYWSPLKTDGLFTLLISKKSKQNY